MNTYFYSGKNDLKEGEIVFVFTFINLFQNSGACDWKQAERGKVYGENGKGGKKLWDAGKKK